MSYGAYFRIGQYVYIVGKKKKNPFRKIETLLLIILNYILNRLKLLVTSQLLYIPLIISLVKILQSPYNLISRYVQVYLSDLSLEI